MDVRKAWRERIRMLGGFLVLEFEAEVGSLKCRLEFLGIGGGCCLVRRRESDNQKMEGKEKESRAVVPNNDYHDTLTCR